MKLWLAATNQPTDHLQNAMQDEIRTFEAPNLEGTTWPFIRYMWDGLKSESVRDVMSGVMNFRGLIL